MKKKKDGLIYTHNNQLIREEDAVKVEVCEVDMFGRKTTLPDMVYHKDKAPAYDKIRYERKRGFINSPYETHTHYLVTKEIRVREDGEPYGCVKAGTNVTSESEQVVKTYLIDGDVFVASAIFASMFALTGWFIYLSTTA